MDFTPRSFQELAGLCWRYDERNFYLLALTFDENRGRVLSMKGGVFFREEGPVAPEGSVYLGLTVREREGRFRYSGDGKTYTDIGKVLDATVLSDEFDVLGFTGAFAGMFCADTARYEASADFKYFAYSCVV